MAYAHYKQAECGSAARAERLARSGGEECGRPVSAAGARRRQRASWLTAAMLCAPSPPPPPT